MSDDKPAFDPSKPFDVPAAADKPAFDPSKPFEAASPDTGSSIGGVAKSLGVGLAQGAIGLAGIPADLAHLYAPNQNDPNPLGSEGIQKAIESKTGDFYKPQGALEETAARVGQFAPAAIGGPEALATKVATRVVAPAVASEAAGKLTEGTVAQPYAELAGALGGAALAPGALRKLSTLTARSTAGALPDVDAIKAAARAQYQHPDVQAVRINPDAVLDLSDRIKADLQHGPNSGFRPANEPKVFSAVQELGTAAEQGRSATVADIDNVRQVLGNAAKEKDATGSLTRQAVAANRAIDHIDDFLPTLRQADLLAGDASKANDILETARRNWGAAKRAEMVQTVAKNAEINAASSHSGANIQNATKQAFKPLLKNNYAKAGGYNDEEKAALDRIVRGTWTGSAARAAGNLLGGGGGLGMLIGGAAGYHEGGIPGAIAAGAAGRGLKMIGNKSTFNAVQRLDKLIRSRAPEAVKLAAQNPQLAAVLPPNSIKLLRTMILAEPALRTANQQRQPVGYANP